MQKTAESIARSGVLTPGIVRPRPEGGYEIIAGHRRKRGSELAGKDTMPVIIRELDDDEATIIMVDSNLQREKLLPSEKAFAYRMKLEALKHQGQRHDLTLAWPVPKLSARDQVAQDAGEKSGILHRYITSWKRTVCFDLRNALSEKTLQIPFNIPSISAFNIPAIAKGSVIPQNEEFQSSVRGNSRGFDMELMAGIIMQAVAEGMLTPGGRDIVIHNTVDLDGKVVARNTVRHINDMTRAVGKPVIDF